MYIDVHAIQSVPPSNINRDESGSPKTIIFGGERRATVSSQSWKRAMRSVFAQDFADENLSVRTRHIVKRVSELMFAADPSLDEAETVAKIVDTIGESGIGVKKPKDDDAKSKSKKSTKQAAADSNAAVVYPEASALVFISNNSLQLLADYILDDGKPLTKSSIQKYVNDPKAVEIELFGRMMADNNALKTDACAQVAFAVATHTSMVTEDFYTALDDVAASSEDGANGAAMLGHKAMVASTFYRYMNISADKLNDSFNQDAELTAKTVTTAVKAFITSMPTGNQNAYANKTRPSFVMLEVREQPVSLVNAFHDPINDDTLNKSIEKLVDYADKEDAAYGTEPLLRIILDVRGTEDSVTLNDMLTQIHDYVLDTFTA